MPKGDRLSGSANANFPGLRLSDRDKLSAVMEPKYGGGRGLMELQMDNAQATDDEVRMHRSFPRVGDSLTSRHGSPETEQEDAHKYINMSPYSMDGSSVR